jgi:kelch-like protein 2/3
VKNYAAQLPETRLPSFLTIKERQERKLLDFSTDDSEQYNSLLTMRELKPALSSSHDTAVGPDKIHYQFLKKTPQICAEAVASTVQ